MWKIKYLNFIILHAASIKLRLFNAPVEEIITESQDAHVISDVEFTSSVEVEDSIEWSRMSVKEVFILLQIIIRA